MSDADDLLLPPGVCLVHIGPHKTGTTAVQDAFHHSRPEVAAHGVRYAGKKRQPYTQVHALLRHRGQRGSVLPPPEVWDGFARSIRRAERDGSRVVLSCESLDNARHEHVVRLVEDLGGVERVHVVQMMRRYDKLLPSQWQQGVVNGGRRGYERWLRDVLTKPGAGFWRRHGYARQASVWADVVGPERVTVVVVDDADPRFQLSVFEHMTGLPDGLLPLGAGGTNRSMTYGEARLVQGLSKAVREGHWEPRAHRDLVRSGAKNALKKEPVDPLEPKLGLPAWAVDAVVARAEQEVDAIAALGVRVVGDLDRLRIAPEAVRVTSSEALRVSLAPRTVALATAGVIDAAQAWHDRALIMDAAQAAADASRSGAPLLPARWNARFVSSSRLVQMLLARGAARVVGRSLVARVLGAERASGLLDTPPAPPVGSAHRRPLTVAEKAVAQELQAEAEVRGWSDSVRDRHVVGGAVRAMRHGPRRGRSAARRSVEQGETPRVPLDAAVRAIVGAARSANAPAAVRAAEAAWRPATTLTSRQVLGVLRRRARARLRRRA